MKFDFLFKKQNFLPVACILSSLPFMNAELSQAADDSSQRISIVGLVDFYTPSVDSSNASFSALTNSANLGWGGGVIFDSFFRDSPLGLEAGLLFIQRQNKYTTSNFAYLQTSSWLTAPVGVKFRFLDLFHVGAGGYGAYRLSNVSNQFSVGDSTLISFDVTNQGRLEFGLYAVAGATIPVSETAALLVEARYLKGLTNVSQDTNISIRSADVVGLAGVQLRF